MHCYILLLIYIITTAAAASLPRHDEGPIHYPGPVDWPNQQSVTKNSKNFGLNVPSQIMTDCLNEYSTGRFHNGWDGNICAGMGWFKGGHGISVHDCYYTCATYLLYDGIKNRASDYQCDFETGISSHCWMGYHPLNTAASNTAPALAAATGTTATP